MQQREGTFALFVENELPQWDKEPLSPLPVLDDGSAVSPSLAVDEAHFTLPKPTAASAPLAPEPALLRPPKLPAPHTLSPRKGGRLTKPVSMPLERRHP